MPLQGPVPGITLDVDRSKARYGVAYLRSICSQAGVGVIETSPDEDVLAVDCLVDFQPLPVRVQVKCTSQWKIHGRTLSFPVEDRWVRNWDGMVVPVYFVVVIVPGDPAGWLTHQDNGTFHSTAAFWTRLRPGHIGRSVEVPKDQRLCIDTIKAWHDDLRAEYVPGAAS
jgi:Domain of unknown function (DUF4365)